MSKQTRSQVRMRSLLRDVKDELRDLSRQETLVEAGGWDAG